MNGIFSGVRIVELAQFVFVPSCTAVFADHGAEVIKVEGLSGDPYRWLRVGDGREIDCANLALELNNRGKKSIALDLKHPDGREALLRIVDTADVFVTSMRPQALKRLGLDVDDLRARNPQVIYARGNGLGFRGREAEKAGYDATSFWARGAFADFLTPPQALEPVKVPSAMGDHASAMSLAMGIASALFHRERSGEPTLVESSLLSNAAWMLSADLMVAKHSPPGLAYPGRDSSRFPLMRPYRTADGRWIQLMLLDPTGLWDDLCALLGLPELAGDPRFADTEGRLRNSSALCEIIAARIAARAWMEWQLLFEAWDGPWELVQTIAELSTDPQVTANDMLHQVPIGPDGEVSVVSAPVSFDGRSKPDRPSCAPHLSADSDEILESLGYDRAMIAELRSAKVVR